MSNNTAKRSFDDEREYLETLLNTRFNFYVVFISIIGVALVSDYVHKDDTLRLWILFAATVFSGLMATLVGRTRKLVDEVLENIKTIPAHPYRTVYEAIEKDKKIKFSPYKKSATWIISSIPWIVTLGFFFLLLYVFVTGSGR